MVHYGVFNVSVFHVLLADIHITMSLCVLYYTRLDSQAVIGYAYTAITS